MKVPPISKDLVDYLQATFPDKLPERTLPASDMSELIGQQRVIRHLVAQYTKQAKTVLGPTQG